MNSKRLQYCGLLLAGLMFLPACKPTEKNYKSAYDAAVAKRQTESNDPDLNLPSNGYHRIDDPQKKTVNGQSYDYMFARVKPLDANVEMQPYNVAVAVYKMPTNCEAQVKDLQSSGCQAFGAKSGDDRYYVLIGTYPTIEEAASAADDYAAKYKDAVYIGLGESPLILQSK